MSESKVIWTGTYAGYAVDVRIAGGVPVQFLDGRRSMLPGDREGITNAAVVGLAAERDALRERLRIIQSTDDRNLDARAQALADLFAGKSVDGCNATEDEIIAVRKTLALHSEQYAALRAERDAALTQLESMRAKRQDVIDGMTRAIEAEGRANRACAEMQLERDVLRERLVRIEGPARRVVGIDNDLAEGRDTEAKASFHDAVMRPIEELRGYFAKLHRAGKRGQTIFDLEVERRKRAEKQRDELRERLARLEVGIVDLAESYLGPIAYHEAVAKARALRDMVKGQGDVET